jgi:hypothetical protein
MLSLGGDGPPYLKRGKLIMTNTPKEAAIELMDEELDFVTGRGDDFGACVAACSEANHCENNNACVDKCATQCLK